MVTRISASMTEADLATQAELDAFAAIATSIDAQNVKLTGDQSIGGVKTFTSQPVLPQRFIQATAQATTSGTAIDFGSIPSWVRRITVVLRGVSTNGTSDYCVRLGTAGGIVATGYAGSAGTSASFSLNGGTGMIMFGATAPIASTVAHAIMTIVNVTGNVWVYTSQLAFSDTAGMRNAGGSVDLGGALTQLRLTTIGGTDTFDAGTVNILYE